MGNGIPRNHWSRANFIACLLIDMISLNFLLTAGVLGWKLSWLRQIYCFNGFTVLAWKRNKVFIACLSSFFSLSFRGATFRPRGFQNNSCLDIREHGLGVNRNFFIPYFFIPYFFIPFFLFSIPKISERLYTYDLSLFSLYKRYDSMDPGQNLNTKSF